MDAGQNLVGYNNIIVYYAYSCIKHAYLSSHTYTHTHSRANHLLQSIIVCVLIAKYYTTTKIID